MTIVARLAAVAALMLAVFGPTVAPAGAQTLTPGGAASNDDPGYLAIGAGVYDVLHDFTAGEVRAEYRFGTRFFGFLRPFVGGMVTTDSAAYGYFGFMTDLYFGSRFVLSPNAAVGLYEKGDGKNLGSTIEFRTGAEFAYRFDDRSRLGIALHHISNAGIGRRNPGEESIAVVWSIPTSYFFK